MTEGVPLVVPEVNPHHMKHIKIGGGGAIIANPNCSTIIALMACTPLHRLATVKRMMVSTYQVGRKRGSNRAGNKEGGQSRKGCSEEMDAMRWLLGGDGA